MFANFTEETCTGTGATLALAGATTNNIAFSKSFADGDLVAYVVEDSGGTIKVAGTGIYVSATDDITRYDHWQWNGTAVTKYPTSNVTLSGGTHTVRCEVTQDTIEGMTGAQDCVDNEKMSRHVAASSGATPTTLVADTQYSWPFWLSYPVLATKLTIKVITAQAGSTTDIGISRMVAGESASTYLATTNVVTTSTGNSITATISALMLPAGWYVMHIVSDAAVGIERTNGADINWSPMKDVNGADRHGPGTYLKKSGVTGGALTADPSTVTTQVYKTDIPLIRIAP